VTQGVVITCGFIIEFVGNHIFKHFLFDGKG